MVDFVDSRTAVEGEYVDPKGYISPQGGYVFVPEPAPSIITTDNNPKDIGLNGLPDPNLPVLTPPQVITLKPSTEKTLIRLEDFSIGEVPIANFGTIVSFTKDNLSFDKLNTIPISIVGILQDKLEEAGLPLITGSLDISYAKNIPTAVMSFFVPNSTEAVQLFNDNSGFLDSLSIICDYSLLYEVDVLGYSNNIEYARFDGNYGTVISIDLGDSYELDTEVAYVPPLDQLKTPEFPKVSTELSDDPLVTVVTNTDLNISIKVPTALVDSADTSPQDILVGNESLGDSYLSGKVGGDRRFNSGRFIDLTHEALSEKRNLYGYTNGVTNSTYSFFQVRTATTSNTNTHSFGLDYSVTSLGGQKLVFSDHVDETLASIDLINKKSTGYNDYPYNAITNDKVSKSLNSDSLSVIKDTLDLNGQPLHDAVISSIREALIKGEETFFVKSDLEKFNTQEQNRFILKKESDQILNNISAMDLILSQAISIAPEDYTIKTKNRLVNWKTLSEDVNKRIVYKTSNEEETLVYIPNNDKITVHDSCGVSHNLEMQDGDFFNASVLDGDDRLTVFSDISKAKVLDCTGVAQASFLANEEHFMSLECTSLTSNLIEYTPDVSTKRQEYYFLKLDKDTIEDIPDTSMFFRKTTASYDYTTTGLDDYVKHKAFPYSVVYLRHDDMIFNHLESSSKAKLTFKDLTLDNFTNTPDVILARVIPQYILVIPTDSTLKCPYHTRSKFIDFNTRSVNLKYSPFLNDIVGGLATPPYLTPTITTTESVNFTPDIENEITYQEGLKYSVNTAALEEIEKYKNEAEALPRTLLPVPSTLQKINALKSQFSLGERDSISLYDLYSKLDPKIFKSLAVDTADVNTFKAKLRYNIVTDDSDTNKTTFLAVKEISNINQKTPTLLDPTESNWDFTPAAAAAAYPDDPVDAPVTYPGGALGI
jgi:hypothetical protein